MSMRQKMFEAASYYRFQLGYSVIPLRPSTKIPAIAWEKFQKSRATVGDIGAWWSTDGTVLTDLQSKRNQSNNAIGEQGNGIANLAVVCGMISGKLVVLDIDPRHGGSKRAVEDTFGISLDNAVEVQTGNDGWHLYYRHTLDTPLPTMLLLPGVELRSESAIVVAPPSVHPETGREYVWADGAPTKDLPILPQAIQTFAVAKRKQLAGAAKEAVENFGVEPDATEIGMITSEVLTALGDKVDAQFETIRAFMLGMFSRQVLGGVDRSGWSYTLARLLIETGILASTDKRKIAVAIFGSAVHASKFNHRSDGWADACRIVTRAITEDAEIAEYVQILTTAPETVTPEVLGEEVSGTMMPFPQRACVGLVGDIAKLLAKTSEAPLSYLYHAALTAFSTLVSSYVTLNAQVSVKPAMYTVILGHSSSSRKSTSMRQVLQFFDSALGETFIPFTYRGFFGSGEGVLRKLEKQSVADTRGVARTMWNVDEFEELISRSAMEHSILAPLLQSLFEDNSFEYTSASKEIKVTNAHISVLSSSTIDTFQSLWNKRLTEGGLLNRLWLVAPEPVRRLSLPPDTGAEGDRLKEQLRQLVYEIQSRIPSIQVGGRTVALTNMYKLPFSNQAADSWNDFYMNELPQMQEEAEEAARRLETYGLRLILLTALSKGELESITEDTVERVKHLLRYQFSVRRALRPPDAASDVARIEQNICNILNSQPEKVLQKRDLYRKLRGWQYGTGIFEHAISNLSKFGFVDIVSGGKGKIYIHLAEGLGI